MIIRRAFRYWMLIAAVALPIWPLIGWSIFSQGGWAFLGLVVAMPILFVAMAAVDLLIYMRPAVRRTGALSWIDVGILALWHALIIAFGFFGATASLFAVLGVCAGVAAFWLSIWQLIRDAARRTRETLAEFERIASRPSPGPVDGGEVIVIEERNRAE